MEHKTEAFSEYRNLLFSIAYNMLGSVKDAEDIVQDTWLKWMEIKVYEVRHTKAYLVKILTNKCINFMNSARMLREEYVGVWLPEPFMNYDLEKPFAQAESYHALSFGILVLLERLTPQERAIFLLKEIFAYDYYELAEIFDKKEENCRQIYRRAKENLGKDVRRFEVDVMAHEKMLRKLLEVLSDGNIDGLIDILKEDIILFADGGGTFTNVKYQRLTAALKPIYGREHVTRLLMKVMPKLHGHVADLSREIIIVNGLPSVITYIGSAPLAIVSIEPERDRISNIYIQTNPDKLIRFKKN